MTFLIVSALFPKESRGSVFQPRVLAVKTGALTTLRALSQNAPRQQRHVRHLVQAGMAFPHQEVLRRLHRLGPKVPERPPRRQPITRMMTLTTPIPLRMSMHGVPLSGR